VCPLPCEEQQTWRDFRETTFPILMTGDIFHDLLTVFIFKTTPRNDFV
jgi:hypothetical protein